MPTPSPSIVPSVGAMLGTEITWPAIPTSARPVPSPNRAVTIGSDIATAVPKAKSRTMIATSSPIASLDSVAGVETSWPR